MKKNLLKIIIPGAIVSGFVLFAGPSFGFVSIRDLADSILNNIKSEYGKLETHAQQIIDDEWSEIAEDARASIESSTGSLGTPDPKKSTAELLRRLRDTRSLPESKSLAQLLERDLTRASVSSVLSEEGQDNTARKIQAATEISSETQDLAEQAQYSDSSQDVLKIIAAQNAQLVSAISLFHSDSLAARQDTAQSNLMLSQLSDSLANADTRDELQVTGQAALTQELIFMSVLDPATDQ